MSKTTTKSVAIYMYQCINFTHRESKRNIFINNFQFQFQNRYRLDHDHIALVEYDKDHVASLTLHTNKPNRTYTAYSAYFHIKYDLGGKDFKVSP